MLMGWFSFVPFEYVAKPLSILSVLIALVLFCFVLPSLSNIFEVLVSSSLRVDGGDVLVVPKVGSE